jgi:hypothetical protein
VTGYGAAKWKNTLGMCKAWGSITAPKKKKLIKKQVRILFSHKE